MEKLGLGPNELLEKNPRLIYSRLTGFGQTGISTAITWFLWGEECQGAITVHFLTDDSKVKPLSLRCNYLQ